MHKLRNSNRGICKNIVYEYRGGEGGFTSTMNYLSISTSQFFLITNYLVSVKLGLKVGHISSTVKKQNECCMMI